MISCVRCFFIAANSCAAWFQSGLKGRLDKPAIDAILARAGLNPECRAEQLDVSTIQAL